MGSADEIKEHPIIFFDGVCNLCNSSVNFVLDRDPKGIFKLASLQSDAAKRILKNYPVDTDKLESIVLLENNEIYDRSDAIIRIAKKLPGFWKTLYYIGIIFPGFFRNWIYEGVARKRYDWFGKRDECRMPTPDIKERFLDS